MIVLSSDLFFLVAQSVSVWALIDIILVLSQIEFKVKWCTCE